MAKSTSESGHLKNLTGFGEAIALVKKYEKYNPSKAVLKVDGLTNFFTMAKKALDDVDTWEASLQDSGRRRVAAFAGVDKLGTSIVAALKANGADDEMRKDAVSMNRKLRGGRAEKKEEAIIAAGAAGETDTKTISVSQRSYDRRADNLGKLRDLAVKLEGYEPNEAELTVTGLTEKVDALLELNTKVADDYAGLLAARNKRDEVFYGKGTGLVSVFNAMKNYVSSVYRTTSPEYRQLTAISIRVIRTVMRKSKAVQQKPEGK